MDLAFDQSRSRDAFSPASTARNNSGVRWPICSETFERSSVVTWWQMAVLGRGSEPAPIGSGTVVKLRSAWLPDVEMGTTMMERHFGVWLNPLWETIITGRRPVCSEPDLGTRSAQKTSPRFNAAPHRWQSGAQWRPPPNPCQDPNGGRHVLLRIRQSLRDARLCGDGGAKVQWLGAREPLLVCWYVQPRHGDRCTPHRAAADGNFAYLPLIMA